MDYPKPLKLIQEGRIRDFVDLLDSSDDRKSLINIKHKKSGDNAAIVAARFGHFEVLEILHRNGIDFEQWNNDGKRALHEAAYGSHLDCVKFLIGLGVDIDCLKRADWTPLLLACTKQDLDIIDALVKAGASLVQCNKDGWDCFHIAAREGHVNILEYLLSNLKKHGFWSSTKRSKNGRTPLHTAALHGKLEAVKFLVDNCNYVPDTPDSCGSTPLMDALRSGHINVAEYLITHHEALIQRCDKLGQQPVHLVAQTGCIQSLNYLIKIHNVDPEQKTKSTAMMPLHFAAKEGHLDVINYLSQLGVNIDGQDSKGRTALHLASAAGHDECVTVLMRDYKANASLRDVNGKTALDFAIKLSIKRILGNEFI